MSFLHNITLQFCALCLFGIIIGGCGTRLGTETTAAVTSTPTWQPVPTFTATVAPATSTADALDSNSDSNSENVSERTEVEPPAVKLIATIEVDTQAAEEATEALVILVPTATAVMTTTAATAVPSATVAGPVTTAVSENAPSNEPYLIVAAEVVNVRRGPGVGYELIGSVNSTEQWPTIGRNQQGDWWQVCCFAGDQPGWLYGELVDLYSADGVPIVLEIPALPTPLPPTPEPLVSAIPDSPEAGVVADEPVAVELPTAPAAPPANSGTAGNFDPNAQFQIVQYRIIGYGENNGGIFNNGGQHIIFINVIDENGQGIDGAVVKDALADDLNIVTGSKGPGRAEFEMFWEPYKLYVASIPAGTVTSQISNQMNTAKPHIPDIIGKLGPPEEEYAICPTPDDRCEPPFFHAHWSYEITFQKVK